MAEKDLRTKCYIPLEGDCVALIYSHRPVSGSKRFGGRRSRHGRVGFGEGGEDCGTSTGVVCGATSGSLARGWVSTESFAEGPSGGAGPPCVDMGGVPVGLPRGATAESEGGGGFSWRYAGLVEGCGLSSGRQ